MSGFVLLLVYIYYINRRLGAELNYFAWLTAK